MSVADLRDPQEYFEDYLRENQLKMTPQRRLILEVFLDMDEDRQEHLTAEELYDLVRQRDDSVGQATVYRTVKLLADSGLAKAVNFGDGVVRYELKYGHEHHDHLICTNCRKTVEVHDPEIEALQEALARKHGFTLTGHKLYLYGVCRECRSRG
jgi:Fur family ferric uptake transcriptional regulator